jgi:transitional endoplasmic reticulum ATPase
MELFIIFLIFLAIFAYGMFHLARQLARRRRELDISHWGRWGSGRRRRRAQDSLGDSPLAGNLLGGAWTRSYVYDNRTGRWMDMTDDQPEAMEEPRPPEDRATPSSDQKQPRPVRARRISQAGPLGGLLSGLGGGGDFEVEPPDQLPTFADVGGMEHLKQEVRDTIGLMLKHPEDAERYGIEWNGVLLHGPPGVGKTFFARAIGGEYRLNLMHVSTGDLVSSMVAGAAHNIDKAFETALQHLPCLLFFDEFDSVAQRREGTLDQESRRTVNQLLTSLEADRDERRLVVMAATNSIDHLDPAVIRPGRFDRHIRIDLPDAEARRAIFRAELDDRPVAEDIDLEDLVRRTEGMTPAAIVKIVDMAALDVFREATQAGKHLELDTGHLLSAVERYGGQDRPTVEHWNWDFLVLPPNIKAQLQQLQAVIEDPERARRFGVDPPTGLLLAGPPGTGKTTIAKVLAAQARCSFYPISGADVMSKWVGESERNIRRLFERARENRPSIIFIDEIDALAGRRGEVLVHDSHVNQLLAEIDGISGQRGVFIVGATNRPDDLDPALLRGGRLSRTIVLGLPDEEGRLAILRLYTARMPTVAVRLEELARQTEGMSPADLKALCQEAGLAAMTRLGPADGATDGAARASAVAHEDFEEALRRLREGSAAQSQTQYL